MMMYAHPMMMDGHPMMVDGHPMMLNFSFCATWCAGAVVVPKFPRLTPDADSTPDATPDSTPDSGDGVKNKLCPYCPKCFHLQKNCPSLADQREKPLRSSTLGKVGRIHTT
jgi:hypothetical protein